MAKWRDARRGSDEAVLRLDSVTKNRRQSNPLCRPPQNSRRNSWHERSKTSSNLGLPTPGGAGSAGSSRAESRLGSVAGSRRGSGSWLPSTESHKEEDKKATRFSSNRSSSKAAAAPKGEPLQSKTVLFVAVPPLGGTSPRRRTQDFPQVFHVHVPLIRAYAPLLYSRLTALTIPHGNPSASQEGAPRSQDMWLGRFPLPRSARETAMREGTMHPAEENAPSSMWFVLNDGVAPEVHIECRRAHLEIIINWMYGTALNISLDDLEEWTKENGRGCELLRVARDLGIDALETAVRRTIFEAISRCGSRLAWGMLSLCQQYGLQRELEHCCTVIARNGGYGVTKERLKPLPYEVIDMLLGSRDWILDDENDIITLIELWMECSPLFERRSSRCPSPTSLTGSRPSTSQKGTPRGKQRAMSNKLEVLNDNEEGGSRRPSMEITSRESVASDSRFSQLLLGDSPNLPEGEELKEDEPEELCTKARQGHQLHSVLWNIRWGVIDRRRLEALQKAGVIPRSLLLDIDHWNHMVEHVENSKRTSTAVSFQRDFAVHEKKLTDAMNYLRHQESKMEALRSDQEQGAAVERQGMLIQEAKNAAAEAEKTFAKSKEVLKIQQSGTQSKVKMSMNTLKWRKMIALHQEEDVICRFLCNAGRRKEKIGQDAEAQDKEEGAAEKVESDESNHLSIHTTWLKRRRAHHGCVHCPFGWGEHLASFSKERDRIAMTLKDVHDLRRAQSNVFTIVSERLMRKGRHELMLRVTQRRPEAGQAGLWNGFRFGLAVFDKSKLGHACKHPPYEQEKEHGNEEVLETKYASKMTSHYSPRGHPPEVCWANEGTLEKCLSKTSWDPSETVPDGGLVDLVIMMVYEDTGHPLRMAAESIVCESSESSAFLRRHLFFDAWSSEQTFDPQLCPGVTYTEAGSNTWYSFCIEVHSKTLACSGGFDSDTIVSLEVLPQGALQRSWWVDIMDRSADGQPHMGAEGPPQWNVLPKEEIEGDVRRFRTSHI